MSGPTKNLMGGNFNALYIGEPSEKSTEPKPSEQAGRTYRILVVEDNKMNLMILQRKVAGGIAPHTLEVAENGQAAVERVKANRYDLIFMDRNMPTMNGEEATREIRKFNQETPIVVQSDQDIPSLKEIFKGLDIQGYIKKGKGQGGKLITTQQVFATIERLKNENKLQ